MDSGDQELPEGVRIGGVFAGRYRIDGILGFGAMGVVVVARHLLLDQSVAIKFLMAAPERHDAVTRFVQEARAAACLKSEHVVRVLDVAMHDAGVPYIVMEHLEGSDLAERLRKAGPLDLRQAVDWLLEACEAIAEAHHAGIVHRDLKPANLFLARREGATASIKVLDFGIAKKTTLAPKTLDAARSTLESVGTGAKAILGTPFYMSPEQMESAGEVDLRTDIWALGVTLFELVTGKPPYSGTSLIQIYSKMVSSAKPEWPLRLTLLPAGLEAVFAKCLQRDRDRRYSSVGDLAADLAPFGSKRAVESAVRIAQILAASEVDRDSVGNVRTSSPEPSPSRVPEPMQISRATALPKPGRWPRAALGAVVALAVAGVFVVGLARRPLLESRQTEARAPLSPSVAITVAPAPTASAVVAVTTARAAVPPALTLSPAPSPSNARPPSPERAPVRPVAADGSARASTSSSTAPSPPAPTASSVVAPAVSSSPFDVKRLLGPRE
jgi:eukaryotic-like serine/threonine-protein kinase